MRKGRAGASYEFMIRLEDPNELFEERKADVIRGRPPEEPGIQQIKDELGARPHDGPVTLAIVLPADKATPEVEDGMKRAVARYCETGTARAKYELSSLHRDGWRTLFLGLLVLGLFLGLSEWILKSKLPVELRDFFGNGLFAVAAWVGVWYPLDTLLYSGNPYRTEIKVLRAMKEIEILVRPEAHEHALPPIQAVPATGQSSTAG
ncbi:MAG TPA: hypothetical protein VGF81_07135 [Solirubrobacteraceae bacterium]|jgi:hypothetical protein